MIIMKYNVCNINMKILMIIMIMIMKIMKYNNNEN